MGNRSTGNKSTGNKSTGDTCTENMSMGNKNTGAINAETIGAETKKNMLCGRLVVLCTVCYFISYVTRINYGAVILEIERAEGISKMAASMAVTGSFITYGAGQLISGWMGDHMKPALLIFSGLLVSGLMNVLVPVCARPELILVFWCINGFAQALMWPPMVKIMSAYLNEEQYKKGCVRVTWGSSVGTIAVYLLAPVCIMWKGWKSLFFLCACAAFCFAFVWLRGITALERRFGRGPVWAGGKSASGEKESGGPEKNGFGPLTEKGREAQAPEDKDGRGAGRVSLWKQGTAVLLAAIMLAIVMQGTLRDGITTWMPSYVSETYGLDSSSSILSGVLLPIFSIICLELTSILNRKLIRNELACAGAVFGAGFCGALLLALLPSFRAGLSIFLAALITGCMYGVNVILVSMIPPYFKKSGNVSTVSGLLNSCTYVGSAVSSYGIAFLAQQSGWQRVIWLWAGAAFLGTGICLGCARRWKVNIRGEKAEVSG